MITEDYCSPEVTKLLDKKGFREYCEAVYFILENGDYSWAKIDIPIRDCGICKPTAILCPTHQMAMKWLRKEYGLHISVAPYLNNEGEVTWVWEIINIETATIIADSLDDDDFGFCEEAVDAALKHVLKI